MDGLGVYVHVPFCAARCGYCDFATWTDRHHLMDDYVDACVVDVTRRFADDGRRATSVFFGGGTPSLLPADSLLAVLERIPRVEGAEVTVECNPDSVDPEQLASYAAGGVTRLSFGVQSMRAHVLAALDRTHDPANVARALGAARDAGFDDVNVDLIYGTPGESLDDWSSTLDAVLELGPSHVSAYALTLEAGTPLARRVESGAMPAPEDDDQAAKYELADERLAAAGLEWYELSNWARPGAECRHNVLYWSGGDYLAVGCAAHGHDDGRRWWNVRTPERYVERIRAGADPIAGDEHLDDHTRDEERLALALRTRGGAAVPAGARTTVELLVDEGLGELEDGRLVLTRRGRLLAGDVTARLLLALEATTDDLHVVGTR